MSNFQLVKSDNFGDVRCDFYRCGDDYFITRDQIGRALEYSEPRTAIRKIHERHKDRIAPHSAGTKLVSPDGKAYETIVYDRRGAMEICRWSQQPKANAFMDFVWDRMEELYTGKTKVLVVNTSSFLRALAMLLNAQSRQFQLIMETLPDGTNLIPVAVELFGLRSLEQIASAGS